MAPDQLPRKDPRDTQFKKGQVSNPYGRNGWEAVSRTVQLLTKQQVEEIGSLILQGNLKAIEAVKNDPDASVLKVAICSVAVKIIKQGDMVGLNQLLDRLIGKVPVQIESEMKIKLGIVERVEAMTAQEVLEQVPKAIEVLQLEETKDDTV